MALRVSLTTHDRMLGSSCAMGPGGKSCPCCNDSIRHKKQGRRFAKRSERQAVRRALRLEA